MPNELRPFHLAVPVHDLIDARKFYGELLNCDEGRSNDHWVDFDFYGHQFVAHLKEGMKVDVHINPVDGKAIPVPHFGVVLDWPEWESLRDRLIEFETKFVVEPYIRFEGMAGEQGTFFLRDFSGNTLELKTFRDINQLFKK